MTSAPPPYGPPPGTPPGPPPGHPQGHHPDHPPRPQRYRPSAWWLGLGVGLVLAAFAVAIGTFIWLLAAFLDFDATIDADSRPHTVTVPTDRDRLLWMDPDQQACQVVDADTGEPIRLRSVDEDLSRSDSHDDLKGLLRFDPGSGHLEVTCVQLRGNAADTVLIGPMPRVGSFVVGILIAIGVPAVLGLAGLAVIVVTGILWSLRPPRPKGA